MKSAILLSMTLMLSACAGGSFENVRLGMSKEEVVRAAGKPRGMVASENVDGATVEVLEYRRCGQWWGDLDETYWFIFNNNQLQKWSRPGYPLRYME